MALQSGLALWAYTLSPGGNVAYLTGRQDLSALIHGLSFSTTAPGGFGDLSCQFNVGDAFDVMGQLRAGARIVVDDGSDVAWEGRWDAPEMVSDSTDGQVQNLTAMGAAAALGDDPQDTAYTTTTAQSILSNQYSIRSAYLPVDSDTSLILPDNPSSQFTLSFGGMAMSDILNQVSPLLGDYVWCVWDHPRNKDTAGFPTWQLQWHVRDATTVSYIAYEDDIAQVRVSPTMEYAFNVVTLIYRDQTTDAVSTVTVRDSRLNPDLSQGTAPFPMRRLRYDLANVHMTTTQATSLVNALLNQYKDVQYRIEVDLDRVHDAGGNLIPLHLMRADRNVSLPPFANLGVALPVGYVQNTNTFYILETTYNEQDGQNPQVHLVCNAWDDRTSTTVAKLQYTDQLRQQNTGVLQVTKVSGEKEKGSTGIEWGSSAVIADFWGVTVNFKTQFRAAPSSVTHSTTSSTNANIGSLTIGTFTAYGYTWKISPTANGAGNYRAIYTASP